jgi:hypothetical protein
MVTPDRIPSDLTLEIGADISPDRFIAAVRAFFGYVEEVGQMLAPDGRAPAWLVRVREGSNLIGVKPAPSAPIEIVRAVYARVQSGVGSLANGDIEQSGLNEAALRHLRALSDLTQADKKRPTPVRIWVEREPTSVVPEISETIREDWRIDYHDMGTVEGRLEVIQDHGGLELRVRDPALRLTVKCYVPEEMLPNVFAQFQKRVEIFGLVHYRRNGTPVSIEASTIDPLPDDDDLPTPEEVRGILRALP